MGIHGALGAPLGTKLQIDITIKFDIKFCAKKWCTHCFSSIHVHLHVKIHQKSFLKKCQLDPFPKTFSKYLSTKLKHTINYKLTKYMYQKPQIRGPPQELEEQGARNFYQEEKIQNSLIGIPSGTTGRWNSFQSINNKFNKNA